jgi:geranylgeranyl diphosphate synthase type I
MDVNIYNFKNYFDKKFINFFKNKLKKDLSFLKNKQIKLYLNYLIKFSKEGKRIRPFIFYNVVKAHNLKNKKNIINIMIAFELLHLFALIQDDVMDKAKTRRDIQTINQFIFKNSNTYNNKIKKHYSNSLAILISDIVFNIFYDIISKLNNKKIINEFYKTINEVVTGQIIDLYLANNKNLNPSLVSIQNKNNLKTSYYTFIRPLIIGGIFCKIKSSEIKKLEKIGILLGDIFQAQDDLFDYYLSKNDKDRFNDLKEGQKTYITYYMLNKSSYKKTFSKFFYKKLNNEDKKIINNLILKSGTQNYIQNKIKFKYKKTKSLIYSLNNKKLAKNLNYILDLIYKRNK